MKKLQVPFNSDLAVLDLYQSWSNYIDEIYFPLHPDIFPSARQQNFGTLEEYNKILILVCEKMKICNIKNLVILNGVKINYSNSLLKKLKENLNLLILHGLDGVVVADPILAAWINKNFPLLKIRLSILSGIYDIPKIKEIEKLGYIKEICLPQILNRNEDILKELKQKTSIKYSTIVNSLCRVNCPMFYWHQNLYSSNSTEWNDSSEISEIKDSFCETLNIFSKNFLKSPFILPNELDYYDKYFENYKLEDRTLPTFRISDILEHYALRINPEYLIDCISGSCIYLNPSQKCNFDKEWLTYRRNCKGTCYNCSLCDRKLEEYTDD